MENNHILSEFAVPESEIDAAIEVGDFGRITIDVEAIGRIEGKIIFRKHKKIRPVGNFQPESTPELRERLIDKQEKEEEESKDDGK